MFKCEKKETKREKKQNNGLLWERIWWQRGQFHAFNVTQWLVAHFRRDEQVCTEMDGEEKQTIFAFTIQAFAQQTLKLKMRLLTTY